MANVLTNVGTAIVTGRLTGGASPTQVEPSFVGIGSGAGTAAVGDTTLFTEYVGGTWSGYARVNIAGTRSTTTVTNDTASWIATFTAPASETVTNAGNFDAATTGNLYGKGDFTGVPLGTGDAIQITIKHQILAG
jgi:hypothetical protein